MYYGSWKIDDLLTFHAVTTRFDTGAATDADSVPTYRVYEDETSTAILTGSMALLDSTNTAGFYSEQITLSAANGFEKGKSYAVYVQATVNSVIGAMYHNFQMEAEVDANSVSNLNAGVITAASIASDAITAAKVADGTIDAATFAAGAINAAAIATDAITATKIAADAIGASELAADAVTEIQTGLATSAALATVQADTDDIQTRLPAALVSGRIDASVGAMAANVVTASAIATDAIGAAELAADAVTEIQSGLATSAALATVAGYVDTEVAAILAAVDTEVAAIKTKTDQLTFTTANQVDARVMSAATDSINAAALATDAVTEIQSGLATSAALAAVSTKIDVIDDFVDTEVAAILAAVDTEVAAIKGKTDQLTFTVAGQVDANALAVGDKSGYALAADVRIKKNTALANFTFLMVDSTDAPKTGLTVTATRSIDGGAVAACANAVTEISNGLYKISLATTDLNGDVVCLLFTATGAKTRAITIVTQID